MTISWVTELINNIPQIISYIVYGYVYLCAYYWISFKDNKDFDNLLIKSVAVSFILINIYDVFVEKYKIVFSNEYINVIAYLLMSAILGFVVGKIISHRWFNLILHKLHIGRTTNENIWDDVIKPYTWVRVFMKDGSSYMGQYRYGEPFQREPIIALTTWVKYDSDGDKVIDNSQNPNEIILINTKDFEKIELVYQYPQKNETIFTKIWEFIKNIFGK